MTHVFLITAYDFRDSKFKFNISIKSSNFVLKKLTSKLLRCGYTSAARLCGWQCFSELTLRWTAPGPAPGVRLKEVSIFTRT